MTGTMHLRQGMQRKCVRSHIPARTKYRDNGVRVLTTWGELNDDASRLVTAVLNSRSHGMLVTVIEVMW